MVVWEGASLCIWLQRWLRELQASNKASSKFCSTAFTLLRKHSRACRIFVWLILAVDRKQTFRLKTFTYLCIDNTNMRLASAWGMRGSACVYSLSRLLQQMKAQGLTKSTHTQNCGRFCTLSWKTQKKFFLLLFLYFFDEVYEDPAGHFKYLFLFLCILAS